MAAAFVLKDGRPSAVDQEDLVMAATLRRGDMLRISSSGSVAPPAPLHELLSPQRGAPTLHRVPLPVQHEIVQHRSSNVVAVGGQTGDDKKEEVAQEEEQIQTQQDLVALVRESLDALSAALWRPPRGTGRQSIAPIAHHPLSLGVSGPIPAERGMRVVLTHEYKKRVNTVLAPALEENCCMAYAHQLKFSYGKYTGKTFKKVQETQPGYEAECRRARRPGPLMKEYIAYCDMVKGVTQRPQLPIASRTRIPHSLTMPTNAEPWEAPALPLCPLHGVGTVTELYTGSATCRVLWDPPRSSCILCVCVYVCVRGRVDPHARTHARVHSNTLSHTPPYTPNTHVHSNTLSHTPPYTLNTHPYGV